MYSDYLSKQVDNPPSAEPREEVEVEPDIHIKNASIDNDVSLYAVENILISIKNLTINISVVKL